MRIIASSQNNKLTEWKNKLPTNTWTTIIIDCLVQQFKSIQIILFNFCVLCLFCGIRSIQYAQCSILNAQCSMLNASALQIFTEHIAAYRRLESLHRWSFSFFFLFFIFRSFQILFSVAFFSSSALRFSDSILFISDFHVDPQCVFFFTLSTTLTVNDFSNWMAALSRFIHVWPWNTSTQNSLRLIIMRIGNPSQTDFSRQKRGSNSKNNMKVELES